MMRSREAIKNAIKLSETVNDADAILKKAFSTGEERYAFLKGMFSFNIIGDSDKRIESDYRAALAAIVNQKWRA